MCRGTLLSLLLVLLTPILALADTGVVKKPSAHAVEKTMERLEALVRERGMSVFARIDHRANAESAGKSMPDSRVLIFGNPKAGTRIMLHDLASGLDLPLRVLVYRDYDGQTWIAYHNPQQLKERFSVEDCKALDKIEQALDELTRKAAE